MTTKIAQMLHVFRQSADTLRKQAAVIESLQGRVESMERRAGARKLASQMHEKGIDADVPFARLASRLEKMAADQAEEYNKLTGAVDLVGPDMGTKQAQLRNSDEERSSVGSSDLVRWVEGQLG